MTDVRKNDGLELHEHLGLWLPRSTDLAPVTRRSLRHMYLREWERLAPDVREFLIPQMSGGSDGLFYWDTREPFITADLAAISPLATAVALYTPSAFPVLGGQYFARVGKRLRIRLFGRHTSAVTPGNMSFAVYYGTGASANGILLASSGAVAWTASQANMSFMVEVWVHCRTTGSVGTLFCTGKAIHNVAAIASTLQPMLIPATAPVVSGACDLTAALIISVQMLRSGSTAETAQIHDMEVVAQN